MASLRLASADTSSDVERFTILKKLADEAKMDLESANAEIGRHQDRHAASN